MTDTTTNKRAAFDWYQDPPEAIEALLAVERFAGSSWDPCCGIGTIPKAMIAAGHRCYGTDVTDRGYVSIGGHGLRNFLADEPIPEAVDNIVCNPPFKDPTLYVDRALAIARHKVACLLPLTFLEGMKRAQWLSASPLARVHVFSWRISMPPGELLAAGAVKPQGGKKAFAWFVWEQGWVGPAQVRLLLKSGVETSKEAA